MKFSIAFLTLLCVSAISSAPVQDEPTPFHKLIINVVEGFVQQLEKQIPGWVNTKPLDDNVVYVVNSRLEAGALPVGWKPDVSLQDNVSNGVKDWVNSLQIPNFDINSSLSANVKVIVDNAFAKLNVPSWFPKDQIVTAFDQFILESLKNLKIPNIDVDKSVSANIDAYVAASLANLGTIDPKAPLETTIDKSLVSALALIKFPGYSEKATLEANIAVFLAEALKKLPF